MDIVMLTARCEDKNIIFLEGDFPESYKLNQILTIMHEPRDKNAIWAQNCVGIRIEHVRLYHCASMGLAAVFCKNITVDGLNMFLDEKSEGIVTANADSVHCIHCKGKIVIKNCIFENMLDDAINIHGNYGFVTNCRGNDITVKVKTSWLDNIKWYNEADTICIYCGNTQQIRDKCRIKKVNYNTGDITLTLDKKIDVKCGDLIENLAMPKISIINCRTGYNRPRGFLLSSGKRIFVKNCTFYNSAAAIHFTGDTKYWYESTAVKDVMIKNCIFDNCNYSGMNCAVEATPEVILTESAPYYHENITIKNCTFYTKFGGAINLDACHNVKLINNKINGKKSL